MKKLKITWSKWWEKLWCQDQFTCTEWIYEQVIKPQAAPRNLMRSNAKGLPSWVRMSTANLRQPYLFQITSKASLSGPLAECTLENKWGPCFQPILSCGLKSLEKSLPFLGSADSDACGRKQEAESELMCAVPPQIGSRTQQIPVPFSWPWYPPTSQFLRVYRFWSRHAGTCWLGSPDGPDDSSWACASVPWERMWPCAPAVSLFWCVDFTLEYPVPLLSFSLQLVYFSVKLGLHSQ